MGRRISPRGFLLCLAAAVPALPAPASCAPPRRPSVVIVVLDALRADRTSPYGYSPSATPFLTGLAEQGTVFKNAYASSNWTLPAFASILTGQRPFSHGLLSGLDTLPPGTPTIQTVLSGEGYATAAFFSGLAGEPRYGLSTGFGYIGNGDWGPMGGRVEEALAWEKKLPPEKDFFILLHATETHWPWTCGGEKAAGETGFPEIKNETGMYYNGIPVWNLSRLDPGKWESSLALRKNPDFLPHVSRIYDFCVSSADNGLAALVRGLEREKGRPLLVIVTADHGELLGEHGRIGHYEGFFELEVRIPLIIRFPRRAGGRRVGALAEHSDLLPTICKAAGIACPGGLDGKDLAAAGEKDGGAFKWAGASSGGSSGGNMINPLHYVRKAAFIENGGKIIFNDREWRLFDLAADPGETRDLAVERPAQLLALLSGYLVFTGAEKILSGPAEAMEDLAGCAEDEPPSLVYDKESASPCEYARLEASKLAKDGDFEGAAAALETSACPPDLKLRDAASLDLLRRTAPVKSVPSYRGYEFSALPGRWRAGNSEYSVSYSSGGRVECENARGLPSADRGCLAPAAALFTCIEKHRFDSVESKNPARRDLLNALRLSGYLP